jgi:hypothetical protein
MENTGEGADGKGRGRSQEWGMAIMRCLWTTQGEKPSKLSSSGAQKAGRDYRLRRLALFLLQNYISKCAVSSCDFCIGLTAPVFQF